MEKERRNEILTRGGLSRPWPGEPLLGGWYTDQEFEVVVSTMRASMNPITGFGFFCDEILEFEQQFADYCGTAEAISITSARISEAKAVQPAIVYIYFQPDRPVPQAAYIGFTAPSHFMGDRIPPD